MNYSVCKRKTRQIPYRNASCILNVVSYSSCRQLANKLNLYLRGKDMWKYESCDIENISLHDHFIDEVQTDGNDILFTLNEGFDVVKTHPLNNTGKSKRTTASQIALKNSKFIKGTIHHWKWQEKENRQEEIDLAWFLNSACSFKVLDWTLNFKAEDGTVLLNGIMYWESSPKGEYSELEFSCRDVLFCWNDYSEDAWFEEWPDAPNKHNTVQALGRVDDSAIGSKRNL